MLYFVLKGPFGKWWLRYLACITHYFCISFSSFDSLCALWYLFQNLLWQLVCFWQQLYFLLFFLWYLLSRFWHFDSNLPFALDRKWNWIFQFSLNWKFAVWTFRNYAFWHSWIKNGILPSLWTGRNPVICREGQLIPVSGP